MIRRPAAACVLWAALAAATPLASAGPPPAPAPASGVHLLNVVVLDTSGSMAGPRLAAAKAEIKDKARRLPPSPAVPYVLIPFHGTAHDVRVLTNGSAELDAYVDRLTADGGTSIAAGLQQALTEFAKFPDVPHIAVLLYTDGEDANRAALVHQESLLDQKFKDRAEHGLGQSVICRRWGTANADLVPTLRRGGHATVVDAGEARLHHAIYEPQLSLRNCRWNEDGLLEVNLQGRLLVQGATPPGTPPSPR